MTSADQEQAGSGVDRWSEDEANVGLAASISTITQLTAELARAREQIENLTNQLDTARAVIERTWH